MEKKQSVFKSVIATAVLLIMIAVLVFVYIRNENLKADKITEGNKNITVKVITPDEDPEIFNFSTDAEYLRQALDEQNLIQGDDSGVSFFITGVNGRVADQKKQEWWCITKGGEEVMVGVDEIVIQDKDQYELTLTVGY